MSVRLPKTVRPSLYKTTLRPCLETKRFSGRSVISLSVSERVDRVVFNSLGLAYSGLRLTQNGRALLALSGAEASAAVALDAAAQTAAVAAQVAPGAAELELSFEGAFSRQLRGLYAARFRAADGSERELVATQFEAVDARRAFPCWDEPEFKARFQLTLEAPGGATAVSNMPLAARGAAEDGLARFEFAASPPMSSYLVAFVVGELGFAEDGRVRVYAPPQSLPQCGFALGVAVRALELFERFFGVPYPLPKLDLVAVPDFASGAMENWGLATFRDSALLCGDGASQSARERVAVVVAHEIAHMWFGNLVTMRWWTDLWLNEGFASFMEVLATDRLFPSWRAEEQFVSQQLGLALRLDALESSHPVEVPVARAEDVDEVFDAISYEKGALLVRMAHAFLGEDAFRAGLGRYFARHSYGNVATADLWAALAEGAPRLPAIMAAYTARAGFPVVSVAKAPGGGLLLAQTRFETRLSARTDAEPWPVPLLLAGGGRAVMEGQSLRLETAPANYVVNERCCGYFRTRFSAEIMAEIALESLPPLNLFALLNDTFALTYTGSYLRAPQLLRLLCRLAPVCRDSDRAFFVWEELCSVLRSLNSALRPSLAAADAYPSFKRFALSILRPSLALLGWNAAPGEGPATQKRRLATLSALADFGDDEVLREGRALFDGYLSDARSVDKDLEPLVVQIGCRTGDEAVLARLKSLAAATNDPATRGSVYRALGEFRSTAVLRSLLDAFDSGEFRDQDFGCVADSVATRSDEGRDAAWAWLRENVARVEERFKGKLFSDFIALLRRFESRAAAVEIESFFAGRDRSGYQMVLSQTVESIRVRAAFLDDCAGEFAGWLKETGQ